MMAMPKKNIIMTTTNCSFTAAVYKRHGVSPLPICIIVHFVQCPPTAAGRKNASNDGDAQGKHNDDYIHFSFTAAVTRAMESERRAL